MGKEYMVTSNSSHKSMIARYIDFNQGLDARLATDKKMKKLAQINIRPLRIAFDHFLPFVEFRTA